MVPTRFLVGTTLTTNGIARVTRKGRPNHPLEFKRQLAELACEPGISVAKLALELVGGFTVKVCSSGEEALREAEAFAPEMILLDVMMPGMDGPTTLQALRALPALATVPVAFMTAKVQGSAPLPE